MPDLEVIAEGDFGGATSVTFSGISQDYQHLSLDLRTSTVDTSNNAREWHVQTNGATGYVYGFSTMFIKTGGAIDANAQALAGHNSSFCGWFASQYDGSAGSTDVNRRSVMKMWFGNYSQTDMTHVWMASSITGQYNSASDDTWSQSIAGNNSTTAITSITLISEAGNFDSTSRYCMYGWKSA